MLGTVARCQCTPAEWVVHGALPTAGVGLTVYPRLRQGFNRMIERMMARSPVNGLNVYPEGATVPAYDGGQQGEGHSFVLGSVQR